MRVFGILHLVVCPAAFSLQPVWERADSANGVLFPFFIPITIPTEYQIYQGAGYNLKNFLGRGKDGAGYGLLAG